MLRFKSYNGGTKPPQRGAGFAFSAKGVTCVAVGFSELLYVDNGRALLTTLSNCYFESTKWFQVTFCTPG